ncbi:MAG: NTPase [Candidatus Eisenbacteria bacterium]
MTSAPSNRRTNLFVTGRPGVGKTTLVERVLVLVDVSVGGFVTRELRKNGRRVGFEIADLSGARGVLAHVDIESEFRVGRYGVNREDLERIGLPAIRNAVAGARLVVMDEIGRMEMCSPAFMSEVERALESPSVVFGTIQDRGNAFLDAVRGREDVEVLRVTEENRDRLVEDVVARLEDLLTWRRSL